MPEMYVQQRLDVQVVGGENDLEKHLLIHGDELLVPLADVGSTFASLVLALVCISRWQRLAAMVFTVLEDLARGSAKSQH